MTDLHKQFQEEKGVLFDDTPINGVHLEYITWLEEQIQALRIHDVVGRSEQLVCECMPDPKCRVKNGKVICNGCNKERK